MTVQPKTTGLLPTGLLLSGLAFLFLGERMFVDGLATASGLAGGLLLVLAGALRLRAFSVARGDQRQVELRLMGAYAGVALALGLYGIRAALDGSWSPAGSEDAVAKWSTVLAVVWPTVLLVNAAALLFMELVYAGMPLPASVELRRVRAAAQVGTTLALSIVFLFSVNYVASERDVRKDFSYFKTTRPGEATRNLVSKLDTPVTVTLFFPKSNDVLDQVRPYFEELAARSPKLRLAIVDHPMAPDLAKAHRIQGNGYLLLTRDDDPVTTGAADPEAEEAPEAGVSIAAARARARAKAQAAEPKGESFELGMELHAARKNLRKLDSLFQQRLIKLTLPPRQLYLTVGHGERNGRPSDAATGEGTRNLEQMLQRINIKSRELGMAQGLAQTVPETASAVAILGPQEPFMPEETQALLSYVRRGGRLVLMLDPGADHGLEPLLEGLGLEMPAGVLASERHHMRRTHTPADRVIVYSNRYSSHPTVSTVNRASREVATLFYRGGALERREAGSGGSAPKVVFPLRSDFDFWLDRDDDLEKGADETSGAMNMMAAVTFARSEGDEGRAVVISDGDFLTDKLIANAGNHLLFIDVLAWLIGEERIMGDVTSEEDVPIEHTQEEDKLWFYATTFAVPLPILLLGIWMMRRRRRGKRGGPGAAVAAPPSRTDETKRAA